MREGPPPRIKSSLLNRTYLDWLKRWRASLVGYWIRICLPVQGCVLVAQSCPTLCDPMGCSPPGSSVHWILPARILKWIAISSRGSSQPRDRTWVFCTAGRFFTIWATRKASTGDTGSIAGPGKSQMSWGSQAHELQWEKPPQWEAQAPLESSLCTATKTQWSQKFKYINNCLKQFC